MSSAILQLCVLSVMCGFMMEIMPEGGAKTVCGILCTVVLIISILKPAMEIDFDVYALESARLFQLEESFSNDAKRAEDNLTKSVIQQKYCEYILCKAEDEGVGAIEVQIITRWNSDQIWVPYSCVIIGEVSTEQKRVLVDIIRDDLGIPEERQSWKDE